MTGLRALTRLEATGPPSPPAGAGRVRPRRRGWLWALGWLVVLGWATVGLLPPGGQVVNPAGWNFLADFWAHALRPELDPAFLRTTWEATLTTVAFAVLGTVGAVLLGVLGAPWMSETWWAPTSGRPVGRVLRRGGLVLSRVVAALPRGVHEAVWGLLLVSVLGRDPLVAVVAIAVPFGAITAKVYSELLDEADHRPYEQLRTAGAGRLTAVTYGLLPGLLPAATSYAFYRFECAIRSAVILGMVGAGGLGLQLSLSFAGLQYAELWTAVYALVLLGAAVDRWGLLLRQRRGQRRGRGRFSLAVGALLVVLSVWHLGPDPARWVSGRTADQLVRLREALVPPALPAGGWAELGRRAVETLQMSVLAISLASLLGLLVALAAARQPAGSRASWRGLLGWAARQVLLLTRALPPPVWALLVLFVVFPGPLPGALALGIYTFGILGRLFAEVVEELDQRPRQALVGMGAGPGVALAYASLPAALGQLVALSLYRWEVTARETVVVGVVGAGGLGRLLEQQRSAFDYPGMAGTVLALIAVCLLVDLVSLAVRASLR
ncbi:PhnE/PtxC family ABC transporter permease [Nocardioides campestrisoli]|uniref:PhnE/PtxC family ABC transporter permease n=1 Tax=Nocardioides campestrisoli TaxID=2736757 RepID=UPI0015E74116|nr:ABC transporter permease subunit [Nocardioides campestrisoli]